MIYISVFSAIGKCRVILAFLTMSVIAILHGQQEHTLRNFMVTKKKPQKNKHN